MTFLPLRPPSPAEPRRTPTWHRLVCAAGLAALCCGTGCVRVYQPLSGLHRPVVVDTGAANFRDVRLTVHCVPEDLLNPQTASVLCQKVGVLFENQGAQVTTTTTTHGGLDDDLGTPEDAAARLPADLTLELRARRTHQASNPLSWAICLGTFTIVPAVTESSFAQEVIIRDDSGFLLVSESLEGRLVHYFGVGSWLGNKVLDWAWRDDDDKITGNVMEETLSDDLYRQLSQLMFNAEMQRQVLHQTPAGRGR